MRWPFRLAALAICVSSALAGEVKQGTAAKVAPISFQAPLVLRGTLGEEQVQMRLRPKAVAGEGLEGEYFVFGHSRTILLAGESEGANLFLEESENGKDVSGHWNARIDGDAISGDWAAPGGKMTKRFVLKVLPSGTKAPRTHQAAAKPAASQ